VRKQNELLILRVWKRVREKTDQGRGGWASWDGREESWLRFVGGGFGRVEWEGGPINYLGGTIGGLQKAAAARREKNR